MSEIETPNDKFPIKLLMLCVCIYKLLYWKDYQLINIAFMIDQLIDWFIDRFIGSMKLFLTTDNIVVWRVNERIYKI